MKVVRLHRSAKIPTRKHRKDAGLDLYSIESKRVPANSEEIFRTGIAVEIPEMFFGFIYAKSKSHFLIGGGIIDQNYRGELLVKICNYSKESIDIWEGNPIAQLLLIPCITPKVEVALVDEFDFGTDRGDTGGIVSEYKTATFNSKVEKE